MDDTTSTSNTSVTATQPAANTVDDSAHRQAYGTAKTENLRDSGLWRILLPGFVLVASVILLAFPLIILTPLFLHSLDPLAAANQLNRPETWIWIVMFLVEVGVIAVIVRGLAKTFLVGDSNYRQ
ncbi:MAG TPA: hypothetical protein VGT44_11765 [Ktedonobacteraceae bacterium]|nr:hypothetical protein [Ktedonobacteraceae bacterium]